MVAARRRQRRTVGLRTLSGSISVAEAKQVEVRSARVRYQARPGRLLGAARLAPAGPPLRAFAATAACSRAAPARPSLGARERPRGSRVCVQLGSRTRQVVELPRRLRRRSGVRTRLTPGGAWRTRSEL